MKIVILGAGPAGLYCGLLIKKANPAHHITIIERNPAGVTYGWGVVFSDRTLASFQRADYKTYEQITGHFVIWDAIDVHYRDEIMYCGGHVIASISRKHLLNILQKRCDELGIELKFGCEINDLAEPGEFDLLIAADGLNSIVRKTYADHFKPELELGKARYIWLGADKVLDAFTFIFRENEHGLFQVHAYPFSGTTSTFIVECDEASWLKAGLDTASEAESLAYCQHLLAEDLEGAALLSNNSKWINFPTLKTKKWHYQNMVLLGDAVHTAHFSIGSGTKLAMEDAIALASALEQHSNLETALNEYEMERKPVVEIFQNAAQVSQAYFETIKRYLGLDPMQFSFQLLTRSGRVTYDDLRLRDTRFGDMVNRWYSQKYSGNATIFAPAPMFAPLKLRDLAISNRFVLSQDVEAGPASELHKAYPTLPDHGMPCRDHLSQLSQRAMSGVGLLMIGPIAVSALGRITPTDTGMYTQQQAEVWAETIEVIHGSSAAKIGIELNHAGRRGATRPRTLGLDKPLKEHGWPIISASPLPYTSRSPVPKEIDQAFMEQVRDDFVRAARWADDADFDLLQLNFAHGYLLASFISPLTNLRRDEYGGNLQQRMRFPLEVFDAVRASWPDHKPISVAISATDCATGGSTIEDAVMIARLLKEQGCDILEVRAGQTTIDSEPAYGRGFLTPLSEQVRNEASIPTMVGGYLTTSNEVNTILAAGRADLCITDPPHLDNRYWTTPDPATKPQSSLRD